MTLRLGTAGCTVLTIPARWWDEADPETRAKVRPLIEREHDREAGAGALRWDVPQQHGAHITGLLLRSHVAANTQAKKRKKDAEDG
ncbi:MAG TPA: hypothetical protein VFU47_08655 [Armatimonadota bacterium]|nr:hypothetical protein [Armatimonadota bacterium]